MAVVGYRTDFHWDLPVKGRNIALFPSITFNPPWTKKYFMTITAIEVMGGDSLSNCRPVQG